MHEESYLPRWYADDKPITEGLNSMPSYASRQICSKEFVIHESVRLVHEEFVQNFDTRNDFW